MVNKYCKKVKKNRGIQKSNRVKVDLVGNCKTGNFKKEVTLPNKPEGQDKKMIKRQERFEKICGSLNIKKGEIFKKRQKKQKQKKEKSNEDKIEIE